MAAYIYVAKDPEGKVIRSSVTAASQTAALTALRTQGLAVVDIRAADPAPDAAAPAAPARRQRRRAQRVPLGELAMFSRQLSIAVGSGMPLRDALESIVVDLDHPVLANAVAGLIADLNDGWSFSRALARREPVFGSLFTALVKAAEESGSLGIALRQLSVYLERSERLERKIKRSTTYPTFVLVFFCIVCAVLTVFVLPRFQEIFAGFDAKLPWLSEVVFRFNRQVLKATPWLALALGLAAAGLLIYRRTPPGRQRIDYWKLHVPVLGTCLRKFAMARFCRNLAMMLRGGVPVTTAIDITAAVSDNLIIRESILKARERLVSGMSISESLARNPEFPRLVVRMVAMGEASGTLPEVLEKASDVYEDEVEGYITTALALLEPVVICVFGAVVTVLILAIYMPVFTIGANVR